MFRKGNNARLHKENKDMKYDMNIRNGSNYIISANRKEQMYCEI